MRITIVGGWQLKKGLIFTIPTDQTLVNLVEESFNLRNIKRVTIIDWLL